MTTSADPAVRALYQNRSYPAMSHPLSDPAVTAVAARLGGLTPVHPRQARILEIGCATGHNLLPLARRWPASTCIGIDLADHAIATARELAADAGIANATFTATDLCTFDPGPEPLDFIIAHGFFSWVPDEVKLELLEFCHRHLAPSGIATISFNLTDGWTFRQPVITLVRQLLPVTGGDLTETLNLVRQTLDPATPHGSLMHWVIDDMLAKGPDILAFDDFGPVNDPWQFTDFLQAAANANLRWLGESDPAENLPSSLVDHTRAALAPLAHSPLHAQLTADFASGRTFRSGVLCRADAPVQPGLSRAMLLDLSLRSGAARPQDAGPAADAFYQTLSGLTPRCVPVPELFAALPQSDPHELAEVILDGITHGFVRPRIEPVAFDPAPPERPALNPLALAFVRAGLPVVDVWHTPCTFPQSHYPILMAMDGGRTIEELATLAAAKVPDLAFEPWLHHLAGRGFFAEGAP